MTFTRIVTTGAVVAALAFGVVPASAQSHRGGGQRGGGATYGRAVPRAGCTQGRTAVPRCRQEPLDRRGSVYGFDSGYGYRFYTPYYAFRPRLSLGFGLWVGYPVGYPYWATPYAYPYPSYYSYPYSYQYPYQNPYPYPYGYPGSTRSYVAPESNVLTVAPNAAGGTASAATGGVSFQITPGDAAVFVDGVYVGTADNFSATAPPLTLAAGPHHFELRAEQYQPMVFEVNVSAGQVIPYQGAMQPGPSR